MPQNNIPPEWWNQILTFIWVGALSIWGGTVHTIKKVRDGVIERFTFREWVFDVVTSGFVGVITYLMCQSANLSPMLTAALIGIASHQGTRALLILENEITKYLKKASK